MQRIFWEDFFQKKYIMPLNYNWIESGLKGFWIGQKEVRKNDHFFGGTKEMGGVIIIS